MKANFLTTTAGKITISSKFLGNKEANFIKGNYNNHKITVTSNGKKLTFDFWSSIAQPEIRNENDLIFSFYCFLGDCESAKSGDFFDFCEMFGYEGSRESHKIYLVCKKSLKKFNRVFECDLYDLINELQETYNL